MAAEEKPRFTGKISVHNTIYQPDHFLLAALRDEAESVFPNT
jgi:hypothetical protein